MAADDVWNVLGDGAGEGVAALLRHGPKVLVSGFRTSGNFSLLTSQHLQTLRCYEVHKLACL